ncbi:hypothetical protein AVEN_234485-1 [Araneus ventricosus]|uniref:Uncharacterized protein n=1 Tax=Araneus ventricosus TaxID=182803 RepID=A0A4Y2A8V1_ARAVE|nr:hypothetical protein AVEN_234485-1 [Araneus ventricosus]
MEECTKSVSCIQKVLWIFLRSLSRLNRDYNPLIHRREEAAFDKDFEEAVFSKDFEFSLEEKITEFKNVLFLLVALITFTVLAFYQWKKSTRFSVNGSKQDNNLISTNSKDYKIFRNEVPADLLQKLLRLHSLLSVLPKQNYSKSWLYNFLSIRPSNFIQKLLRIKSSCSTKPYLTNNLSGEKYWNEVERGLRESLKSLKTLIDPTSTSLNSIDMADKSIQVNEELVFQILEDGFEVEDTAIKSQIPEQANGFNNIVLREHQQMELVANNRTVPLKQATYLANRPPVEIPLIDAPRSSLDGNTLNIQIEFDRRVLLGKLAK